jgi:tRNA (mo5U34)-methyltransferase
MPSAEQIDFGPYAYVRDWDKLRSTKGWWHSFELPGGRRIDGAVELAALKLRLAQFPIPEDLRGKRVLDIGAWDGWYSFEMERRGAEVMAIDCWDNPRFREVHEILQSRVDYRQLDIYELTPTRIGRFDIVLFMGVLYHLKHPLLALERVCALATEMAAVESFVLREEHLPGGGVGQRTMLEFYETDEFGGQTDNWIGPTLPCLLAFCRTAGFARTELRSVLEHGASVACYRRWEEAGAGEKPPVLREVFHHTNFGINFRADLDDYLVVRFDSEANHLGIADVKPEAGGFGVRPIVVERSDDCWQAKFKLPPGLTPGWHDVTVRTGSGGRGNVQPIAVDLPAMASDLAIGHLFDAKTWKPNELDLSHGNFISLWVAGLPDNADKYNLRVFVNGKRIAVTFVERGGGSAMRQVNAAIPGQLPAGEAEVTLALGASASAPAGLRLIAT